MDYKVSVIIPVYNAEKTLEKALLSVKNQTIGFENIELLLCDDCSTDGSFALIEKWAAEYPNVRALKTKKNSGGPGAPRNVALDVSSAEFVMFLDSDDEYLPDACGALYEAMCRHNADAATGYSIAVSDGGAVIDSMGLFSNERVEEDIIITNPSSPKSVARFYSHGQWSKIYRKDIIDSHRLRFPENVCGEDVPFSTNYMMLSQKAVIINKTVLKYLVRRDSISHDKSAGLYKDVPSALLCGYETAVANKTERGYCAVIEEFELIDSNLSEIIESDFSDKDIYEILKRWSSLLIWCVSGKYRSKTGYPELLALDFANNESKAEILFDFKAIKKIKEFEDGRFEDETAQRQKELDDIYGSTTWKLASLIQKLKFWSK